MLTNGGTIGTLFPDDEFGLKGDGREPRWKRASSMSQAAFQEKVQVQIRLHGLVCDALKDLVNCFRMIRLQRFVRGQHALHCKKVGP